MACQQLSVHVPYFMLANLGDQIMILQVQYEMMHVNRVSNLLLFVLQLSTCGTLYRLLFSSYTD